MVRTSTLTFLHPHSLSLGVFGTFVNDHYYAGNWQPIKVVKLKAASSTKEEPSTTKGGKKGLKASRYAY